MPLEDEVRAVIKMLDNLYRENVDINDQPMIKTLQKASKLLKKHF